MKQLYALLAVVTMLSPAYAQSAAPTPDEIHAELENCGQAKNVSGHMQREDPWPNGWEYCIDIVNAWEKVGAKWHEEQKTKREDARRNDTDAGKALVERLKRH